VLSLIIYHRNQEDEQAQVCKISTARGLNVICYLVILAGRCFHVVALRAVERQKCAICSISLDSKKPHRHFARRADGHSKAIIILNFLEMNVHRSSMPHGLLPNYRASLH